MKRLLLVVCVMAVSRAQNGGLISDPQFAESQRKKYLALTDGWADAATFTRAEREAMERGRQWEDVMTHGLDDPLAKRILAAGEPSFDALNSYYPGKILDRTVLGTYSDPRREPDPFDNEFSIWWNGAISADLRQTRVPAGVIQPVAHNTTVLFRVGSEAEMFGANGERYSRIGYQEGYLPIVTATYQHDGVTYKETALADRPAGESGGWDIAYVRFEMTNASQQPGTAELDADIILIDGSQARTQGQRLLNASGALLLAHSDPAARFDAAAQRLSYRFELKPAAKAAVYFKIPYVPDPGGRLRPAAETDFNAAHRRVREFWTHLLDSGAAIQVPEERVNRVWRALLLQNFILADGRRFTYGSGLRYNDSYYPQENGFGGNTFAVYGHKDYSAELLGYCVPVSFDREMAGRKYQNRRGMPLHHLLENYRLTGRTDVFERYKEQFYRVAEEIIADRRSTMAEQTGQRPLHWGLLPPDKPGVDLRASTQTVYVLGHNITNCQGLADFGELLIRSGIDRERGRRYLDEAKQFRQTLLDAMRRAAIRLPDRPPFVDLQTLYFHQTPDHGPDPYDDLALGRLQGTYWRYWLDMELQYNFFNPEDDVGRWMADYAAQRGGFVLGCGRARSRPDQPYGWINNVYNAGYYNYRLRAGRIEDFLLGFYSRLAFGMSRHAYVASETSPFIGYNTRKGGFVSADYSFPNSAANSETLSMLRNMLVLEELKDDVETGDVWLLRGIPRAWLEDGKEIRVARAPTYFGDISFTVRSRLREGRILVSIEPPGRDPYRRLLVSFRHPQRRAIARVRVNGADHHDFDAVAGVVRLARGVQRFEVDVLYQP